MKWRKLVILAHISLLPLVSSSAAEAQSAQPAKNPARANLPRAASEFYIDARGRRVPRPTSGGTSPLGGAPYICTPSGFGTRARCFRRGERR